MKPGQRIASIQGRSGTVRIVQQAKRNSRVVPVDLITGEDTAESELVATELLRDIRAYKPEIEIVRTIRIPNRIYERLTREARPGETQGDALERILPPEKD